MKTYNKGTSHFSIKALIVIALISISNNANAVRNLLVVNVSPDLENSYSRALSRHFVEQLESHYPGQYTPLYRDLEKEPIPYVHSNSLEVIMSGTTNTLEAKTLKSLSDTLINEIEHADAIIIATPMHNFTVPAVLKAYFDLVLLAGKTFTYTSNGPEGMLTDRPVMLISSSGGCYQGTERDFLAPYVKCVLSFIGIKNCIFVGAEGLAMKDQKETSLSKAKKKLEENLEFFYQSKKSNL